jgi:hypothetical protein
MPKQLVRIESRPLAETNPDDKQLPHLFDRFMNGGLPGFIVRQAGTAFPDAITNTINALPAYDFQAGRSIKFNEGDSDLHIDRHEYPPLNRPQVNLHYTSRGAASVTLLRPRTLPFVLQAKARYEALKSFQQGLVDPELIIPIGHTATLSPGDMVIFQDSQVLHKFRTTSSQIRISEAQLHYVAPRST